MNENVGGRASARPSSPAEVVQYCKTTISCWARLLMCCTGNPVTNDSLSVIIENWNKTLAMIRKNKKTQFSYAMLEQGSSIAEDPYGLEDGISLILSTLAPSTIDKTEVEADFSKVLNNMPAFSAPVTESPYAVFDGPLKGLLNQDHMDSLLILLSTSSSNSTLNETVDLPDTPEDHDCFSLTALQCALQHYEEHMVKEIFNLDFEVVMNMTAEENCTEQLQEIAGKNPAAAQANGKVQYTHIRSCSVWCCFTRFQSQIL